MFYCRKKTLLQCSLFSKVSEIMKRYVLLFQKNEPAIFRIFPEQLVLFREFVSYFVRPEIIDKHRTVKSLMSINFEDISNHLPQKLLVVGIGASKIIKKAKKRNDSIILEFLKKALLVYSVCAKYLASKLPLNYKFFKTVTVLDPCVFTTKSTSTLNALENLPTLTSIISSDEEEKYQQETHQIIVDFELPSTDYRADKWWYSLEKKYQS